MRLTAEQIKGIISAVTTYLQSYAELRLYGSRVRDDLKGGDIDLLITDKQQVNQEVFLQMILPESVVLHTWGRAQES